MNFLLLSGSFRRASFSQALLHFVAEQLPEHHTAAPDLRELPFYCQDIEGEQRPAQVLQLLEQVSWADALIICTPEYNHSIPAVLKNAIDWASRPAFKSPLKDKPVTFITQANSPVGGARAQAHLKLVFDSTLSRIHMCHEMMIAAVEQKFDQHLSLTDEHSQVRIRRHLHDFIEFIG
ncbi:MAG: NADPH-dependent FMN reductase [Pseudomonas sp.]|uniref:NADPH-dependent FMN reductase n=1 Tax=Pseudomonas sp. TaxID=306 RepID=UPI003BB686E1